MVFVDVRWSVIVWGGLRLLVTVCECWCMVVVGSGWRLLAVAGGGRRLMAAVGGDRLWLAVGGDGCRGSGRVVAVCMCCVCCHVLWPTET